MQFFYYRKRVDNVPGYVKKQTWLEIRSELTRYAYDLRESALRFVGEFLLKSE